ncbi:MAG: hypothetical protein O7B99_02020 [Planctomycetota bacterium]|nr:hypothetical protein [Planctomycetota bacterium]
MSDKETLGPQRVAAFLLSLGPEQARRLMGHIAEDVVLEVAQAMVDLDPALTDPDRVRELSRSLAMSVNGPIRVQACATSELESMLETVFGAEKARQVLAEIGARRLQECPFLEIESEPPGYIGRVLDNESPAVAALVLAHLDPATSAAVLEHFEDDEAIEIIQRMATLIPPSFTVLRSIASDLRGKLDSYAGAAAAPDPSARLQTIADLLSHSAPEMEKNVLDAIQSENAEMAAALQEYLFTWEDLATVERRAMQKILGAIDTKTLSLAMKACSKGVEESILGNLSSRVKDMVAEERELLGPVPMADMLAARDEIMRAIRALIEAGEFRPNRGGEEFVE